MSNSPQVPSPGPPISPKPPTSTFTRVRRWWMKLFGVRFMNPNVSEAVCETCDRYGEQVIGAMLAGGLKPSTTDLQAINTEIRRQDARDWLTERNSIREYRERWIPLRDLILELVIIGLIGGEIYLAIEQGKQQSQNFDKQQKVLTNLQKSSEATVHSLDSAVQSLNQLTEVTEQQAKELEEYQKQALARPDFALDYWFADATPRTLIKNKMQPIIEYEVRYENFVIFAPIIRNTSKTSAHNVRILIGLSDTFESIDFAPRIFSEVQSSMAGWRVFQREVSVFHPGPWQVQVIAKIKADTPDGRPQMSVSVDGSDLTRSYQQWLVFRKKSVSPH